MEPVAIEFDQAEDRKTEERRGTLSRCAVSIMLIEGRMWHGCPEGQHENCLK